MKNKKNVSRMKNAKFFIKLKFALSIFILISSLGMQAQNVIKGIIQEGKTGQKIPGVTVTVKGTSNSTVTDFDGTYKISVANPQGTLVFSYIGFTTVEEAINNRTIIDVALSEENNALNEVVIIGYGSVKKSGATGAISSLKAKQLDAQSNTNLGSAIQGKVAGVSVEAAGGSPGSGTRIQIRGAGSLNNNNPLILVDDIQVASMNSLSPSDIESIEVLKDAAAAAIYGSRAANGVIIITTKSGKKGDIKVSLDVFGGVASVTKQLDLLNQEEWAKVSKAAYSAAGKAPLSIALNPEVGGAGVDYQDEIFRVAPTQNYSLGFLGGSDKLKYSMSLNYYNQEGIIKETNYERFNMRVKSDYKKGIFKIGETILLTKEKRKELPGVPGQGRNVLGSAITMIPGFAIYDQDAVGGYGGASGPVTDIFNPVAALNLFDVTSNTYQALLNTYLEATFFEGLKYKLNLGATVSDYKRDNYTPRYEVGGFFKNLDNDLSHLDEFNLYTQVENTLNYTKSFGKNYLNALVGYTVYNNTFKSVTSSVSGLPDNIYTLSGAVQPAASGYNLENNLVSYLGRLIYSYDDKYSLSATIRRDGSSRFSPDNKWGNFQSVSAACGIG